MRFNPCNNNCTPGAVCQGCGRTMKEMMETRRLIDAVAQCAVDMGYENIEEFTAFVGTKAAQRAQTLLEEEA